MHAQVAQGALGVALGGGQAEARGVHPRLARQQRLGNGLFQGKRLIKGDRGGEARNHPRAPVAQGKQQLLPVARPTLYHREIVQAQVLHGPHHFYSMFGGRGTPGGVGGHQRYHVGAGVGKGEGRSRFRRGADAPEVPGVGGGIDGGVGKANLQRRAPVVGRSGEGSLGRGGHGNRLGGAERAAAVRLHGERDGVGAGRFKGKLRTSSSGGAYFATGGTDELPSIAQFTPAGGVDGRLERYRLPGAAADAAEGHRRRGGDRHDALHGGVAARGSKHGERHRVVARRGEGVLYLTRDEVLAVDGPEPAVDGFTGRRHRGVGQQHVEGLGFGGALPDGREAHVDRALHGDGLHGRIYAARGGGGDEFHGVGTRLPVGVGGVAGTGGPYPIPEVPLPGADVGVGPRGAGVGELGGGAHAGHLGEEANGGLGVDGNLLPVDILATLGVGNAQRDGVGAGRIEGVGRIVGRDRGVGTLCRTKLPEVAGDARPRGLVLEGNRITLADGGHREADGGPLEHINGLLRGFGTAGNARLKPHGVAAPRGEGNGRIGRFRHQRFVVAGIGDKPAVGDQRIRPPRIGGVGEVDTAVGTNLPGGCRKTRDGRLVDSNVFGKAVTAAIGGLYFKSDGVGAGGGEIVGSGFARAGYGDTCLIRDRPVGSG